MYSDGGKKLARTGMRNKLFILHGLIYMCITNQALIQDLREGGGQQGRIQDLPRGHRVSRTSDTKGGLGGIPPKK